MSGQAGKLPGGQPQGVSERRQYLTPAQAAELLQLDVSTVYRLAATDPTMPATRVGRSVRFRADRLDAWLEARTQGRGRKASRTRVVTGSEPDQVQPASAGAN